MSLKEDYQMPSSGDKEGTVYLGTPQGMYFQKQHRRPLPQTVIDNQNRTWTVEEGKGDKDERNFGLFENDELIAHFKIYSGAEASPDCPTDYWWTGKIQLLDRFHKEGIGTRLHDAIMNILQEPLASDLDQKIAGTNLWKRLIRQNPGKIVLLDASGNTTPVNYQNGSYQPNPWAVRNTRLVRLP
ncbi:hypothetical protein IC232_03590 [Microvirga sp. BT688]|uniref:hypothetical protein n=1 Tax=Microvirga sp. TaxID=1873136 RepID=UPI0016894300|nr:hypothetical protein [Microvirga sp.]MBD2745773.1 hypothetical protein [Microvirga sp.]